MPEEPKAEFKFYLQYHHKSEQNSALEEEKKLYSSNHLKNFILTND